MRRPNLENWYKNENIVAGLGQCIAAMAAAQIFDQRAQLAIALKFSVLKRRSILFGYTKLTVAAIAPPLCSPKM